ncbi:MAG TPA: PQQ-binding-like beta-propeller repeat protein [Ktedonobacterales bacterium]|nr:PQQ-binding-like beta-propeller repeat protein [Ktedonobacterales bacterium]
MHAVPTVTAGPAPGRLPATPGLPTAAPTLPTGDPSLCSPGSNLAPLPATLSTLYVSTDHDVVAINAADGTTRWSYDTGASSYPVATPDGAQVFVAPGPVGTSSVPISTTVTEVVALGANDGAVHWHAQFAGDANAGAPTLRLLPGGGGLYVAASDGTVRALDAATGRQLWIAQIATGPVGVEATLVGGVVYATFVGIPIAPGPETFAAVRASDGTVLWHLTYATTALRLLMVANGLVYAAETETATTLVALNAGTGVAQWRVDLGALLSSQSLDGLGSAVAAGTGLYVTAGGEFTSILLALNASTGAFCWSDYRINGGASAPVLDGTLLYLSAFCGSPGPPDPGTLCVYAFDARSGASRWHIQAKGAYGGIGSASLVNGALYVTDCPAFALRADSGATIWSDSESPFFGGMTVNLGEMWVIGATAYAAYRDGTVRALDAATGAVRWSVTLSGQLNTLVAGA